MKIIIIIFCLFISRILMSQSFGVVFTSGIYTMKDVSKEMDKEIRKGENRKVITQSSNTKIGDTLTYVVQHNTDGFTVKYTFNLKENEEEYCDFEKYIFDCSPCSQKHLKEFIKLCEFRKKSDFVYLSNYFYKTEMVVSYKSDSKDCLVLTFKYVDLYKKDFKKIYNSLPKPPIEN
jgi:hypothetical protein